MPTESTSADRLLDLAGGHFSAVTLQRGRRYAQEGRVRIKSVEERADEIHVAAEVRGTQDEPYDVELWLGMDGRGEVTEVDGVCMCPVEEDCKHIVAVLLKLEEAGAGQAARRPEARAATDFPEPSAAALEWLGELADQASPRQAVDRAAARVLYLLRPGDAPSLGVARSRPLKKGGQGKPAAYRPQPYDLVAGRGHRGPVTDADIAPLRLFLALQAGGGYFYNDAVDLAGETGGLLLRLALATGNLQLDGLVETPLRPGPAIEANWVWGHDAQGL